MADEHAAARLLDEISHTEAMAGFLTGLVVGLAVGVAIVAVTVATGGAALAVVAAVGTGIATTGGGALLGESLGETYTTPTGTIVIVGSPNVLVNTRPAARATVDAAICSQHAPGPPKPIAQGSSNVFINNFPAARVTDLIVCGAKISSGSPDVFIGGGTITTMAVSPEVPTWMNNLAQGMVIAGTVLALGAGAAAAAVAEGVCGLVAFAGETIGSFAGAQVLGDAGGIIGEALGGKRGRIIGEAVGGFVGGILGGGLGRRAAAGHPVDIASGELFTEVTDFRIGGTIPLIWSRVWMSSSMLETENGGALGSRWHHSYDLALYVWQETGGFIVRLGDGRLALFTLPAPGRPSINAVERLVLDTDGRRYWMTDYDGRSHQFGDLDPDTQLRYLDGIVDQNSNSIMLKRGPRGRLLAIQDSAGRAYDVETDAAGRIRSIDAPHPTEPGERLKLVSYSYDAAGDLVSSRDARGGEWQYRYDTHLMISERHRGGLTYRFVWDDVKRGREARCIETWGESPGGEYQRLHHVRFQYDVERGETVYVNGEGARTRCRWNDLHKVTEEHHPLGSVTRTAYDGAGRIASIERPGVAPKLMTYDELGRLTSRKDPEHGSGQITYAAAAPGSIPLGRPATLRDAGGGVHTLTYDGRGNLATSIDPLGNSRRFIRDARGLPLAVIDGEGVAWRWQWSPAGDLVVEGPDRAARRRYQHDRLGRVISIRHGDDAPFHIARDDNGNIARIDRPDGNATSFEYDPEDRQTAVRDALGRVTRWRYGGLRYPLERTTADGRSWRYSYNSEMKLVALQNPKQETYQLRYDLEGRLAYEQGFDGRELHYAFSLSGWLVETRDAGRPTRYRRDQVGRAIEKHFADGTVHRLEWNAEGRLVSAGTPDRELRFSYDPLGRIVEEYQDEHVLRHQYDQRGRLIRTILPDDRTVEVGYGSDNLFASVMLDGRTIARVRRDNAGRQIERQTDALLARQEFDTQGRLVRQSGTRYGGAGVFSRSYSYDADNALIAIDDELRGALRFRYDDVERLISAEGDDSETFAFDPADNLIGSQAGPSGAGGYAVGDRLLVYGDRAFEYDVHGNRVRARRGIGGPLLAEYAYDGNNQLREAQERGRQGGQVTRFGYDALGRRAWKECIQGIAAANDDDGPPPASRRTQFLWNGDVLLSESGATDDPLATVYLFEPMSFRPLAQVRRPSKTGRARIYHYHLDRLGTPQEVTNENGQLAWAASYKAWGGIARTIVEEIPQPIRFQGQYCDSETGLHYNRARYYSPAEGRFIQHDPIRLIAGPNFASYAPNPIQYVDPFGLVGLDEKGYSLYHIVDKETGDVVYVGITDDAARRQVEHQRSGRLTDDYEFEVVERKLKYREARGYEQADIEHYGTLDTSRIGEPMEGGEPNRVRSYDPSRTDERAIAFDEHYQERIAMYGGCG